MMVERPKTLVTTFRTGHMGCTFRFFCDGRTPAACGPRPKMGGHDNACRDFGVSRKTGCKIFDREGTRAGRAERSVATPGVMFVVLPCVRAGQLICWRSRSPTNQWFLTFSTVRR